MAQAAISVSGVAKRYHVFDNPRARVAHLLFPRAQARAREIWALRDINVSIERGESVAIIGRNGSGKSTLLEIIAGTLAPTCGAVEVGGRVSALLELGSGFNSEYTGRDNVLINGMLLGLARSEILGRLDEIVAFAEIGDAIDLPVKTYSSGMLMRLAFAVQVITDPQILIIDEALSVGDFFFQQKCFAYIRSLHKRGVTLLFVSHDMATVRDLCSRAVYLKHGRAVFIGETRVAISKYLAEGASQAAMGPPTEAVGHVAGAALPAHAIWSAAAGDVRALLAVEMLDAHGAPATRVRMGEALRIRAYFQAPSDAPIHLSIVIKNRYDQIVSNVGSYGLGLPALTSPPAPFGIVEFELTMRFEAGLYSVMVTAGRPVGSNTGQPVDETGWLGPVRVDWNYEEDTAPFLGMFGPPVAARLLRTNELTETALPVAQAGSAI
ncbi:MAG TPA: ABC transporter ATP-binding protein [Longimicrobiales bacterium]